MALDPRQKRCLDRFYPGLVEDVAALHEGQFVPHKPTYKTSGGVDLVRDVDVWLRYEMTDGTAVELRLHSRLVPGGAPVPLDTSPVNQSQWERYHYALHYGGRVYEAPIFRFDLDDFHGYHVHIPERTPAEKVTPDTRNMEPRVFVKVVAKYRQDKIYPVQRTKQ